MTENFMPDKNAIHRRQRQIASSPRLRRPTAVADAREGFALIAVLLLLILVSAISVGLVLMVQSERKISGSDLENTSSYYAAEAGMEKMTNDVADLYHTQQAPNASQITGLGATPLTLPGATYTEYSFAVPAIAGVPTATVQNVSQGPFQGLLAQIIPITLLHNTPIA